MDLTRLEISPTNYASRFLSIIPIRRLEVNRQGGQLGAFPIKIEIILLFGKLVAGKLFKEP